jgi:hypothetical protein
MEVRVVPQIFLLAFQICIPDCKNGIKGVSGKNYSNSAIYKKLYSVVSQTVP